MKKILTVAVAAVVAASLIAPATAAKPKGKKQTVEGTIAMPARHPEGCYTGLSRHLWSLFGEAANGVVGYVFDVDKATYNKPFVLEGTAAAGTLDLDLSYYLGEFATQQEWVNDPLPAAPATVQFETHEGPGETGKVPEHAVKAVVCVFAGEGGQGAAGASFTYTAGKGVKPAKS